MAEIDVVVNGRSYRIACEDGEEDRLMMLSEHLNRHATELAKTVGQVGETRLMLMAGLLVADELGEALDRTEELADELAVAAAAQDQVGRQGETMSRAARRIEELAGRIKSA
ncbi:MAG: cell division protein ZapA [Proteobacteria bacterium]|nr:cell division protein ZapA [Pseudomonadota bacterium]